MAYQFLVHELVDTVGVAVQDIPAGVTVEGRVLSIAAHRSIRTQEPIPLGHKVALCDIAFGEHVVEYGCPIGEATAGIKAGQHVHVHNLCSIRWRGLTSHTARTQMAESK